jgi:hypothetical protein
VRTAAHHPQLLGAYVMDVLDPPERRAVEAHLAGCEPCQSEVAELEQVRDVLGELPPEALIQGPPDADLVLARTLRRMRAETGSAVRRRRAAVAVAASIVLAGALGVGLAVGRRSAPDGVPQAVAPSASGQPTPNGTRTGTVVDPRTGTRLTVSVAPFAGWVRVSASVDGIPAGENCRLVVVTRGGARQSVAGWIVSEKGAVDGVNLDGSVVVAPADVAAVEVRNVTGRVFATVKV